VGKERKRNGPWETKDSATMNNNYFNWNREGKNYCVLTS